MKTRSLPIGVASLLLSGPVLAWDISAEATARAEYQSNEQQINDDEQSGWNYQPGANVDVTHAGERIQVNAGYQARRQINQNDDIEDATYLTGGGMINWGIVPNIWNVYAENERTRTTIDNRQANNPNNQQIVDQSTVGTNAFIPIGRHSLILQAETGETNLNEEGNDSETESWLVGYQVPVGDTRQISLTHQSAETEFDDIPMANYESETTSIWFNTQSRTIQVNARVGHTTTELENSSEDVDGVTGEFDVLWQLDEASSLQFNAARDITDNINGRRNRFFEEGLEPDLSEENSLGGQIFEATQYTLLGRTVVGSNRLTVAVSRGTRDFQFVDTDELRHSITAQLDRRLTDESGIGFSAEYVMSSFEDAPHDDSYSFEVDYDRQLTRRLNMAVDIGYIEQESRAAVRDFDGWVGSITFRYTFLESTEGSTGVASRRVNNFGTRL